MPSCEPYAAIAGQILQHTQYTSICIQLLSVASWVYIFWQKGGWMLQRNRFKKPVRNPANLRPPWMEVEEKEREFTSWHLPMSLKERWLLRNWVRAQRVRAWLTASPRRTPFLSNVTFHLASPSQYFLTCPSIKQVHQPNTQTYYL